MKKLFFLIFLFLCVNITFAQPGGNEPEPNQSTVWLVEPLRPMPNFPYFNAHKPWQKSSYDSTIWVSYGDQYITRWENANSVWSMEAAEYLPEYRFAVSVTHENGNISTYPNVTKLIVNYTWIGSLRSAIIVYIANNGETMEQLATFEHTKISKITVKLF